MPILVMRFCSEVLGELEDCFEVPVLLWKFSSVDVWLAMVFREMEVERDFDG